MNNVRLWRDLKFLSTPSARRATADRARLRPQPDYFYPRPLRGGRLLALTPVHRAVVISIHALCEEGDTEQFRQLLDVHNFYPRPLRGGRPNPLEKLQTIHGHFYPRPLRGGRRKPKPQQHVEQIYFYPRPLRGGRLLEFGQILRCFGISIHALCEEGDSATRRPGPSTEYFYPRPLRGGRRCSRSSREC